MRLFEFGDLAWVPHIYHYYLRVYLIFFIKFVGYDKLWAKQTEAFIAQNESNSIMEYGSGSGEPLMRMVSQLNCDKAKSLSYTMSDLKPLPEFVNKVNNEAPNNFVYFESSVDAANHKPKDEQAVVFINSFHHLPPKVAHNVIKNNLENGNEMLILEYVRNNLLAYLSMLGGVLIVLLTAPFISKLKHLPLTIIFTYIIPLFPLMMLWDGLVSCRRAYNTKFFDKVIKEIDIPVRVTTDINRSMLYPPGTFATSIVLEK